MNTSLKTTVFEYEFTGSNFTEQQIIEQGHLLLSGKELLSRISNKTILGDYPMGYKFATDIYENGTANGINNMGTVDSGNWTIDFEKNTLKLEWENGWINTLTRAYLVNGNIEFYDSDTGNWRTTFKIFKKFTPPPST